MYVSVDVDESTIVAERDPEVVKEILDGLRRVPKHISSKFLYDEKGSLLFDEICDLPEYYPTRTETAIMEQYADEMVRAVGEKAVLIELGSGSSVKTRLLLDNAKTLSAYVPVDISAEYLNSSVERLRGEYPELVIEPVAADYTRSFSLPSGVSSNKRKVVYFPGSTFGNFYPEEGLHFLRQIRDVVGETGGLLIGLDWRKDKSTLEAAYNDSQGVTAAFNLNILSHVNRLAGGDFDEDAFEHYACFDEEESRIEIYVVSKTNQEVQVANEKFVIDQDEAILTEVSYKHRPVDFFKLATSAGFTLSRSWSDPKHYFGVLYLTAS